MDYVQIAEDKIKDYFNDTIGFNELSESLANCMAQTSDIYELSGMARAITKKIAWPSEIKDKVWPRCKNQNCKHIAQD